MTISVKFGLIGIFFFFTAYSHAAEAVSCLSAFQNPYTLLPALPERQFQYWGERMLTWIDGQPVVFSINRPASWATPTVDYFIRRFGVYRVNGNDPKAIENDPSVNCHGYACSVSGVPGLPDRIWIRAKAYPQTLDVSAYKVILEKYFDRMATIKYEDEGQLKHNPMFREGDLVVFHKRVKSGDEPEYDVVHTGILVSSQNDPYNRFWVRSKMGENPITLDTPLGSMNQETFFHDVIEIWRRKVE